jgi:hypothetical protein
VLVFASAPAQNDRHVVTQGAYIEGFALHKNPENGEKGTKTGESALFENHEVSPTLVYCVMASCSWMYCDMTFLHDST